MANNDENLGDFYVGRTRIRPNKPQRKLPPGILTGAVLLAFVAIVWYAYPSGDNMSGRDIPVVEAGDVVVKEIPEDPRGMEIPHQDSTIFEKMDMASGVVSPADDGFIKDIDKAEKITLLPKEETPVDKKIILQSRGVLNSFAQEPRTAPDNRVVERLEILDSRQVLQSRDSKPVVEVRDIEKTTQSKTVAEKVATTAVASGLKSTYVQLGSYREKDAAEKDWWKFKKKYGTILDKLDYRIVEVDLKAKGIYHRLQAGKLTKEQAANVCAQINEQQARSCLVVN